MPYTYLIKFIPDGRVYYGVRFRNGCHPDELLVDYHTSSKEVKKLIEEYGVDAFEKQIRRVFLCPEKAKAWETKVLVRIDAMSHKMFINKSNNKLPPHMKNPEKKPLETFDFVHWKSTLKEKMSRAEVGRRLGIHPGTYYKYEKAGTCPAKIKERALRLRERIEKYQSMYGYVS